MHTPKKTIGSTFLCPDCGRETVRTGTNQQRCHDCAAARNKKRDNSRGRGPRMDRRFIQAEQPRTLAGLSIVQVDRLAKELHTSYGRLVAGSSEEQMKRAAGAATPTAHAAKGDKSL